jgi:DinB superfamily
MDVVIEQFLHSWSFVRRMTYDFIDGVPERHWLFSPHPSCAPLAKQFRHMIGIAGLYNDALRDGRVDFARKRGFYPDRLDKSTIVEGLRAQDRELERLMQALGAAERDALRIDFGGTPLRFGDYTTMLVQHEALHQGVWALCARLAGFPTPALWQREWIL